MEEEFRVEAQAKLAAIVESSDDAIISKTLDGIITTWNSGAQRIFGYTAEEIVGRPVTLLIPPERADEEPMILATLRRGERVDHLETLRVCKDGRRIHVSVTSSPVFDPAGRIIGVSKIVRDITAQKEAEQALLEARDAAEAANLAKDQFLSVLSHELRTPLTPVLGAVNVIERHAALPPVLRKYVEIIRRNIETEARLVDDLLDLTRISQGKVQLFREEVDAHAIAANAIESIEPEATARGVDLHLRPAARRPWVWADGGRLQQILLNLLANSIKFTPRGGSVTLSTADDADQLLIEVCDTGIGIEPELMPRLFDAFEQGDSPAVRRAGGLGLGLSIVRALVELHGGQVDARSQGCDTGACLTLRLPALPSPRGPQGTGAPEHGEASGGRRILFVEDHADTRVVMSLLLESLGCKVSTAATVKEALDLADRQRFDLLVSDIGLPDGSGMDVMRHVAGQHRLKGIAISGYGQEDDLLRSQEAGFALHLVKPVNIHALRQAIQELTA